MNEASVPLPLPDAPPPLPSIRAVLRRRAVREDVRFFLLVYAIGFLLFSSWLA